MTYNTTYNRYIKMKPVDVKTNIYIDFNKENNKECPKFKAGNHVRISKDKNIFANWSEEEVVIKKNENAVPRTYVINDLTGEEIVETFYDKEFQKTNQKE